MKKIFAFVVCMILLVCAFPICAFAEGEPVDAVEQTVGELESLPTAEEIATEGEISGEKAMPDITTEAIVGYIKAHFEEISVVVSLICAGIYNIRKHKLLNRSISATNKNAIAVSENSALVMQNAIEAIEGYKNDFAVLLEEYRTNAVEKQKLEQTLNNAMTYIKTAKLANTEFANELAELLVLANIPNSKKDELYSRHIAAVSAITEAEKTEVNTDDDGKEA